MKKKTVLIILAFTVVILAFMAASTISKKKEGPIADAIGMITTPVEGFFSDIGNGIKNGFSYFESLKSLRVENASLKAKVDALEQNNRELSGLKNENERLRALIDMQKEHPTYTMIGAKVVAKEPGNWFSSFAINKGTIHGLSKGNVVVCADGLVGHIAEIGTSWARVVSIIDPESSCGAVVKRSNDQGLIEGSLDLGADGLCQMTYVAKDAHIVPGDYVESSGLGEIFPPDFLIGKVREVHSEAQGISQTAVVEPSVNFEKLSEVLVIKELYHPVG